MDYTQMTAPCGLDCFNCHFYLARHDPAAMAEVQKISETYNMPVAILHCKGCRNHEGKIPLQKEAFGPDHECAAYECARERNVTFCSDCGDFPCKNLHPYADRAAELPHNIKVFNLCLIKQMGVETWAKTRAAEVRKTYFTAPWTLDKRNGETKRIPEAPGNLRPDVS